MVLINTATKIYAGNTLATKVYRGTVQVWPPAAAWGPDQSVNPPNVTTTVITLGGDLTVGNRITCAVAGRITALRFLSSSSGETSRVLRLWAVSSGLELANATVTYNITSGWKSVSLAVPVLVTGGQVVIVSLETPSEARNVWRRNPPAAIDFVSGDLGMERRSYSSAGLGVYPVTQSASQYFLDVTFQKAL
jgi:hypothetical protein